MGGNYAPEGHSSRKKRTFVHDEHDVPRVIGLLLGIVLGVLGGLAFAGWEAATVGWLGFALPPPALAPPILGLYLATGGVIGGFAGLVGGWQGSRWAAFSVVILAGWLATIPAGRSIAASGGLPPIVMALTLGGAIVVGFVFAKLVPMGNVLTGFATTAFLWLAVAGPLHMHLLGGAGAGLSRTIDLVVLLLAVVVGGLAAAIAGQGSGPAIALGLALIGGVGWGLAWPRLEPETRIPIATADSGPPIVVVVITALRADHVGAYGHDRATTPHLDALARNGVVYTDATAAAPWTLPSLGSIFTGVLPVKHGAGINNGFGGQSTVIRADIPRFPQRLQDKGYVGAAFVGDPEAGGRYGFHRGFARYDDGSGPSAEPLALAPFLTVLLEPVPWPVRDGAVITDEAIAFVNAQEHRSWLLFVDYGDLEPPHRPDEEDVAAIGAAPDASAYGARYDAALHRVDRHLGRLLDALPADAWVIVTSDHGEELDETRPERGGALGARHGHSLYQEVVRVPLIVRAPGVRAQRVTRVVSTLDIAPTVIRAARAEPIEAPHAHPLVEVVGGAPPPGDRAILAQGIRWGQEQQMARIQRVKYVETAQSGRLYDLLLDPREKSSIIATTDLDARYTKILRAEIPAIGAVRDPPPSSAEQLADLLERVGLQDRFVPAAEPAP